jgi:hypothetical protein
VKTEAENGIVSYYEINGTGAIWKKSMEHNNTVQEGIVFELWLKFALFPFTCKLICAGKASTYPTDRKKERQKKAR